MNFLVMSDLHLEHAPMSVHIPDATDAVILAGDIALGTQGIAWASEIFEGLPVIYVPGNHEFYGCEANTLLEAMRAEAKVRGNVLFLEKNGVEFPGVRLLGTSLWTGFDLFAGDDPVEQAWAKTDARRHVPDFDGRIRYHASSLSPDITQRWHAESRKWLAEQLASPFDGQTVVVTHHAPSLLSVPTEYATHPATPAWASPLENLVEKANFWIHGHVHQTVDKRLGGCRLFANPRGYPGESANFDPACLLKI